MPAALVGTRERSATGVLRAAWAAPAPRATVGSVGGGAVGAKRTVRAAATAAPSVAVCGSLERRLSRSEGELDPPGADRGDDAAVDQQVAAGDEGAVASEEEGGGGGGDLVG